MQGKTLRVHLGKREDVLWNQDVADLRNIFSDLLNERLFGGKRPDVTGLLNEDNFYILTVEVAVKVEQVRLNDMLVTPEGFTFADENGGGEFRGQGTGVRGQVGTARFLFPVSWCLTPES